MDEVYDLNHKVASLAIANTAVQELNKLAYSMGKSLQTFGFYTTDVQKKYGVVDLKDMLGYANPQQTLEDNIVNYRIEQYKSSGVYVDGNDAIVRKSIFFDYLMSTGACYVEVPKYVTKNGLPQHTYDKYICTRNPVIMAAWMGCQPSEMQAKYSARIGLNATDFATGQLRFVKLMSSAKGNSISVPRGYASIENMVCMPLFMINAYIQGLKTVFANNIVKFTFLKDNDTIREMPVTISADILSEYYDNNYVANMLTGVDIDSVKQGGLMLSSRINRGYIKVPEVGGSIYDATGVRSLNIVRILKAEIVTEVDRTFINVDLASVVTNFNNCIDYAVKNFANELGNIFIQITGVQPRSATPVAISEELKMWCQSREIALTTTFQRLLHIFMVQNPQWFPLYTGKPALGNEVVSSAEFGVVPMDF